MESNPRLGDEHVRTVRRVVRRLGVRADDADDLTQDVLLTACRRFHTYDARRPLAAWLHGICLRVVRDFRKQARFRRETLEETPHARDEGPGPEETLLCGERQALLHQLLDRVPRAHRELLVLHDLDERSMPEISRALSMPLNTAYSRLRLGRRALRTAAGMLQ